MIIALNCGLGIIFRQMIDLLLYGNYKFGYIKFQVQD